MIPYGKQKISRTDIKAVKKVLDSDFLTTGPKVSEFEEKLKDVTGANTVVLSSGTAALHAAFFALDIKPGDEIITSPMTFIATQAAAALAGAENIFCDIDLETGNLDPNKVKDKITKKTKAICVVDYAGNPGDLDSLREICNESKIKLIEDAAHSLGTTYKNRKIGSIADLTTFSFFPTKNITTGEGGAVSGTDSNLLDKVRTFSRQGLIRNPDKFQITGEGPWHQEVHYFGLNYRLPDVLCALGISQLKKINDFKKRRQDIFNFYIEEFENLQGLKLPKMPQASKPMWHLFSIHLPANLRRSIYEQMRKNGIGVQVNYMPSYWHPVFKSRYIRGDFPMADEFYSGQLSLPMGTHLTNRDLKYIVKTFKSIYQGEIK